MDPKDESGENHGNGSGAAAILAAGVGAATLGILDVVADKSPSLKSLFVFYEPTGPLSGVTTTAILVWLIAWRVLDWRWGKVEVNLTRVNAVALALLGLALLLTFPPVADLF